MEFDRPTTSSTLAFSILGFTIILMICAGAFIVPKAINSGHEPRKLKVGLSGLEVFGESAHNEPEVEPARELAVEPALELEVEPAREPEVKPTQGTNVPETSIVETACDEHNSEERKANPPHISHESEFHGDILVTGAWLRSNKDPQGKYKGAENVTEVLDTWYDSVVKFNMAARIFYDNLSIETREKYTRDDIKFVQIPVGGGTYEKNPIDYRFIMWHKYFTGQLYEEYEKLKGTDAYSSEEAEIYGKYKYKYIIMTDLRDVEYMNDPRDMFKELSDYDIVVGSEEHKSTLDGHWWFRDQTKKCEIEQMKGHLYSCGILGGKFDYVQAFLEQMYDVYEEKKHQNNYCDMLFCNWVIYRCGPDKWKLKTDEPVNSTPRECTQRHHCIPGNGTHFYYIRHK